MRSLFCRVYGGRVGADNKQETNTRSFQRAVGKTVKSSDEDRVDG